MIIVVDTTFQLDLSSRIARNPSLLTEHYWMFDKIIIITVDLAIVFYYYIIMVTSVGVSDCVYMFVLADKEPLILDCYN